VEPSISGIMLYINDEKLVILLFLGLQDPDPLVRGMDPDPDPSIIVQK
jgi:hypothetical protein